MVDIGCSSDSSRSLLWGTKGPVEPRKYRSSMASRPFHEEKNSKAKWFCLTLMNLAASALKRGVLQYCKYSVAILLRRPGCQSEFHLVQINIGMVFAQACFLDACIPSRAYSGTSRTSRSASLSTSSTISRVSLQSCSCIGNTYTHIYIKKMFLHSLLMIG